MSSGASAADGKKGAKQASKPRAASQKQAKAASIDINDESMSDDESQAGRSSPSHGSSSSSSRGSGNSSSGGSVSGGGVRDSSGVPGRFVGQSLYSVLGVSRDASRESIQKAYRRMAISCHPDRNPQPTATAEFQYLSRCHEVLSDSSKRRAYDLTGRLADAEASGHAASSAESDAAAYWRSVFPHITLDDLDAYREKYVGSEEERDDLLDAWSKYGGHLDSVFESVPFASSESAARLCDRLNQHADAGISSKQVAQLKKRLAQQEKSESAEAEEAEASLTAALSASEKQLLLHRGDDHMGMVNSLRSILQARESERQQGQDAHLAHLESKYASKKGKRKQTHGKASDDKPPAAKKGKKQ